MDVRQNGDSVEGEAKLQEPALGQYEYKFTGVASEKELSLNLVPGRRTGGLNLGRVQVVAALAANGEITGRWKSDIGTEGIFHATKYQPKLTDLPKSNSVFLVHGHDDGAKHSVARFLDSRNFARAD
ncbi:MAG: nucleotide-binding protein [Acidobacteriota bacterium]|nr:nucleotide-binding protein [Acidobacteriota bacterium]